MTDKRTVIDFRKRRFIQVTREVIYNEEKLTKPVDIAVYTVLCMYADNDTKTMHPSVATIAKKARSSERVVHRSLRTLQDAGYIEIVPRYDHKGAQASNQYILLDVSERVSEMTEPPC